LEKKISATKRGEAKPQLGERESFQETYLEAGERREKLLNREGKRRLSRRKKREKGGVGAPLT